MKVTNDFGNKYKGTIGKNVTATTWKGRNFIRRHFKPTNRKSPRQTRHRDFWKAGSAIWNGLSPIQKNAYKPEISYMKSRISPYNAMIQDYITTREKGLAYNVPYQGTIEVTFWPCAVGIPNVKVIYKISGNNTPYLEVKTDSNGQHQHGAIYTTRKVDIFVNHPGYIPYENLAGPWTNIVDIDICLNPLP